LGAVKNRIHLGFDDPDAFSGSETEILQEFRRVRDEIDTAVRAFYDTIFRR
jgi:arsenate reductase